MKLAKFLFFTCLTFLILNCEDNNPKQLKKQNLTKNNQDEILVEKIMDTILVDGIANEKTWEKSSWYPINQVWIGEQVDSSDFTGRYKLSWSKEALYVLVEIKDDFLVDKIKNPLERWWDDDCVEIFIDEDNSGGNHKFNHNAFAYHVGLNGDVVDLDGKDIPKLFNSHIDSKMTIGSSNTTVWEFKIYLFPDTYTLNGDQTALNLFSNKKIGFAIAYCDNDQSELRENFFGSVIVEGDNKNRGWIDANIFGTIKLKK